MDGYIILLPEHRYLPIAQGRSILSCLQEAGLAPDVPCGGKGTCGKCRVLANGESVLACQTKAAPGMTVEIPQQAAPAVHAFRTGSAPYCLALDVGTTTLAAALMDKNGILAEGSLPNPQRGFGGDVVTRLQACSAGSGALLTQTVRQGLGKLIGVLCQEAHIAPEEIESICPVGNPAMIQLLFGMDTDNLRRVPFAPVITEDGYVELKPLVPGLTCKLRALPHFSGFVGSDTLSCLIHMNAGEQEKPFLLIDIGTNAEMVLGDRHRRVSTSAAAGPALEGANIRFGMAAAAGSIHKVWVENGKICVSTIDGKPPVGICGSGLVDAVAAALDLGLINARGKVLTSDGCIHLTENIFLTQQDIRQVQLAKGAIAAGIHVLASSWGIALDGVADTYIAGAFGAHIDPQSARKIGLFPAQLTGKITSLGNAALLGACDILQKGASVAPLYQNTQAIALNERKDFPRLFGENTRF